MSEMVTTTLTVNGKRHSVEGVIKIVPLKYGVGVLADTPWAAMKAKS